MTFDSRVNFCHAAKMLRPSNKFVAVLLSVWLPFFSGNAMASSIAMQMKSGSCPMMAAQSGTHSLPGDSSMHPHTQNMQSATSQTDPVTTQAQPSPRGNNASVCHFACIGYLVTVIINAQQEPSSAQIYTPFSSQFQSAISIPLDPPPVARV